MNPHVIFVAPFVRDATLRFVTAAARRPDARLNLIRQDAAEKIPARIPPPPLWPSGGRRSSLPRQGQHASDSYEGDGYVIIRDPDSALVEQALRQIAGLVRVELAQGWIAR